MSNIDKEWYLLLLIPLFFLSMSKPMEVREQKPGCFPDYRPPKTCMRFEKLP